MKERLNNIMGAAWWWSASTERLRFCLVVLFSASLPFIMFYSNIFLFLLLATTLLDFKKENLLSIPRQFWIFQLPYFLAVIGYFYSADKQAAGFLLERQLMIFLFPLLLPLAIKINEKRKKVILHAFTLSLLLSIFILFINTFLSLRELGLPLSKVFSRDFFNHQFSAPLEIHAGYLSLYVSLSIFHIMQMTAEAQSRQVKAALLTAIVFLFSGLFFLASRNTIITTVLVIIFVFPFFYLRRKKTYIMALLFFCATGMVLIYKIDYLRQRFVSQLIYDINARHDLSNLEGAEPRIERWKGALELFTAAPLFGYGTGDEIGMLKVQYMKRDLYISYMEDFNAHNQYLSYLLKNGLLGLAAFVLFLGYFLRLAIKRGDFIYLSFLILLCIGFFTENILDANKGIFFFALFNTLFACNLLNNKQASEHS